MNGTLVTVRAIGSLVAVLGLLGLFVWALRRGSLKLSSLAPKGTIAIETAMSHECQCPLPFFICQIEIGIAAAYFLQ